MIRQSLLWMRRVLPPGWTIALWLLVFLCLEAFLWRLSVGFDNAEIFGLILRPRDGFAWFGCAVYGVFRVGAFHPVFRPPYRQWLKATPWQIGKPLPLGPVHLVWQDVVVLTLLALALHDSQFSRLYVPLVFLLAYLGTLCVSFSLTKPVWCMYGLVFGLAGVVQLIRVPIAALSLAVALYLFARVGLRHALRDFPWQADAWAGWLGVLLSSKSREDARQRELGWPYDYLRAAPPNVRIGSFDGILISLAAGVWVYVLSAGISNHEERAGAQLILLGAISVVCVVWRTALYCWDYWPPISLWGRFRTFRWIIPRYDRVFLAPIAAALTAWIAPGVLIGLRIPETIAVPMTISLVVLITLNAGPTLNAWRLTGGHRMGPILQDTQNYFRL